jgi:hypothetical protein
MLSEPTHRKAPGSAKIAKTTQVARHVQVPPSARTWASCRATLAIRGERQQLLTSRHNRLVGRVLIGSADGNIGLGPRWSQLAAADRNTIGAKYISFHIGVGVVTEPGRRSRRHLGRDVSEQRVRGLARPAHLESGASKRRAELSIVEIGAMTVAAIIVIDRLAAARLLCGEAHRSYLQPIVLEISALCQVRESPAGPAADCLARPELGQPIAALFSRFYPT